MSIIKAKKEYIYARIKNVHSDEAGTNLFLYAGLTKITVKADTERRKKNVKPVVAKLIDIPLEEAPEAYVMLVDQEIRAQLDHEEFKRLQTLSEVDLESFMVYDPSINQKILSMNAFLKTE